MKKYNPFLNEKEILDDALFLIKQIIYFKQHNYEDELIVSKLNLEYIDWANNFQNDPEKACGHFTLGNFATYDIEIHFLVYKNQDIGFEISLNQDEIELKEIFIFDNNILSKGKGFRNLLNENFTHK